MTAHHQAVAPLLPTDVDEPRLTVRPVQVEPGTKVWVDLENSPHVPFFRPIIAELERRGCSVLLTARDCFQVCQLADLFGMSYRRIGHHYGKHKLAKAVGLAMRVTQMAPMALRERPHLAISHGSRSMFLLASLLRIPTLTLFDYEHAQWLGFVKPSWVMAPEVITAESMHHIVSPERVLRYPGIKEDVYVPSFIPDPALRRRLGLSQDDIVICLRPPADEAHYHNPDSERLLAAALDRVAETPNAKVVLVPRTPRQEERLRHKRPELFAANKIIVPSHVVNGLDLIWASDLVISGGGTMNREAAALQVPVYSIFRGKIGAVDEFLASRGRLVLLESPEDVRKRLSLRPRDRSRRPATNGKRALDVIVDAIVRILSPAKPGEMTAQC